MREACGVCESQGDRGLTFSRNIDGVIGIISGVISVTGAPIVVAGILIE